MTLKQAMKKMKVKEIKYFYFDDYGKEYFLVAKISSNDWVIERYLERRAGWLTLQGVYRYDELKNGLKIWEKE